MVAAAGDEDDARDFVASYTDLWKSSIDLLQEVQNWRVILIKEFNVEP